MIGIEILLYGSGLFLLLMAIRFAMRVTEKVIYTERYFTDFSGDVQAWLRSE